MEGSDEILVVLHLFANAFFSFVNASIGAAVAILIRHRTLSWIVALLVGAIVGLVGTNLEFLNVYLTSEGWAVFGELEAITVLLSMLATFTWWVIARFLYALARRKMRRPQVRH